MNNPLLERQFYLREVLLVARKLLGKRLVSIIHGKRVSGIIYETEAYDGEQDLACHAKSGKTSRNATMYGNGGFGYIYFTYGMHWMFNCVVDQADHPAAVLIRAIYPTEGIDIIRTIRKPIAEKNWCNGPAKLTRSLGITGVNDGVDLCDQKSKIFIEDGNEISDIDICTTPRIGIDKTPEPWKSKPWRFFANLSNFTFCDK